MTKSANMTLQIDLEDFEGKSIFAEYHLFIVGYLTQNFKLTVGSFEGINESHLQDEKNSLGTRMDIYGRT